MQNKLFAIKTDFRKRSISCVLTKKSMANDL